MKNLLTWIVLSMLCVQAFPQSTIVGRVIDSNNDGVEKATVTSARSRFVTNTDQSGIFNFAGIKIGDTIIVTMVGYLPRNMPIHTTTSDTLLIRLVPDNRLIEEVNVLSTGYQTLPKERATGSFTHIGNELINRSVSTNIMDRLEGVTNSLLFDRSASLGEGNTQTDLRIRGVSSIRSETAPLIILDNFPYEGNLDNINPNDIKEVTILKDAAAASIWGSRAGNGVIVLTTKKGDYQRKPTINYTGNYTFRDRPNLFYDRGFLGAEQVIEVERTLFNNRFYAENDWTILSPAVELFIRHRDGLISDVGLEDALNSLRQSDIRKEAHKELYRVGFSNQQSLGISGGTEQISYRFSAGYDRNLSSIVGNDYRRITLSTTNDYKPFKGLLLSSNLYYTNSGTNQNGLGISEILPSNATGNFPYPYTRLRDALGMPLPVNRRNRSLYNQNATDNGLLDWQFRPLDEVQLGDNTSRINEFRLNTGARLEILASFTVDLKYQFQNSESQTVNHYAAETYYVRDLVNRYTQADGTRILPDGGILEGNGNATSSHYGRAQINYSAALKDRHEISALGGAEVRQIRRTGLPGFQLFGYDDNILIGTTRFDYETRYRLRPTGTAQLPAPPAGMSGLTDRFLSYFFNGAYTYSRKYTISLSSRWDASNLFGVKTNQKGSPLWSSGLAWLVSNEPFLRSDIISFLKLRATFGYSGNVNPTQSALPIISYSTDVYTGLPNALIRSAGNPELRWEKVATVNLGLDFSIIGKALSGSVDFYRKNAADLIGENYMNPTSGIIFDGTSYNMQNRVNYANLTTRGIDVELSSRNTDGKIKWHTDVLFNYAVNNIDDYMADESPSITNYFGLFALPVKGKSRDVLFALPWNGLDPSNGSPLVMVNGEMQSAAYVPYINSLRPEDLLVMGVSVAPVFGSVRNTLTWKNLSLSANILWKSGYKFRRSTINYETLFTTGRGHIDYTERWRNPRLCHPCHRAILDTVISFTMLPRCCLSPPHTFGCKTSTFAIR